MRKFLLGMLTAIALPAVAALGLFLFLPKLEAMHDAYASVPAFVVRYPIVFAARDGNFERAAATLNRQANMAEFMGMNDGMRRDLVENTRYLMARARYPAHYAAMLSWLNRLKGIAKYNYLAKLMAAEAASYVAPALAEKTMLPVRNLAPGLDRAYRPVMEAGLAGEKSAAVASWCQKYAGAQGAAFGMYEFGPTTFEGQNVGAFFLEVRDPTGKLKLLPHEGFKLNERRRYVFEYGGNAAQDLVRLHIPSLPGVLVINHGVMFKGPQGDRRYDPKDLAIVSRRGFFLDATSTIITSFQGDILSYAAKGEDFPASEAIIFDLEMKRLPLSNHQSCLDISDRG
jgi:hypothetical protein